MQGFSLFNAEACTAARHFLYSSIFWLLLPGAFGLLLASLLYVPELHDRLPMAVKPYLSFGRLRPTHVNLTVFGWLSMVYCDAITFIYSLAVEPQTATNGSTEAAEDNCS